MDHMGDGALPDHSVIQAHIRVDLLAVPQNGNVQHHSFFNGKIPAFQAAQSVQRADLQLCQKAQSPHVDTQHGDLVQRRQLGQMQDRPIAAKGDDQIRALQLRQQRLGGQISEGVDLRIPERRTDYRLKAHVPQNGNGGLCGLHSGVPVRIRTENDFFRFHYTVPSPCSFRV